MEDTCGSGREGRGRSDRSVLADYLQQCRGRLIADGSVVSDHAFTYGRAVVGMLRTWRWYGPVAVATVVVAVRSVTSEVCDRAITDAVDLVKADHGDTRKRALSVLVVVAGETVSAEARAKAMQRRPFKYGVGFMDGGAFVWPAVADLGSGESLYYRGSLIVGSLGSDRIREKLEVALGPLQRPSPA